jgi:threonine/homoserine/homoserine lactone efflux protein
MMYLVSRTLSQGRRAGLISLGGVALGFVSYLLAASLGLAALFGAVPVLYVTIKTAGAMYLLWLAWMAVRPHGLGVLLLVAGCVGAHSGKRLFAMGLTTNLLNPKAALLYGSLLPQFVPENSGHLLGLELTLGAVQIGVSLSVNCIIIVFAGALAVVLAQRPVWLRAQRYVTGTLLAAIAVRLIREPATT